MNAPFVNGQRDVSGVVKDTLLTLAVHGRPSKSPSPRDLRAQRVHLAAPRATMTIGESGLNDAKGVFHDAADRTSAAWAFRMS
ncbi:hypothetical protein [Actinophytocola sp.]|uniref:hypothetical protein n=1 Tax=Actinophytocola sp. TaxID=1872138 RepID=UPI002ECFB18B